MFYSFFLHYSSHPAITSQRRKRIGERQMELKAQEHYDLIAMFEREPAYKGRRLDKEAKELWPRGVIYQDGYVNELFLAYRRGCAYGRVLEVQAA